MQAVRSSSQSGLRGGTAQGPRRAHGRLLRGRIAASSSQAELLVSAGTKVSLDPVPPTYQVDLTPLFQEYEPKPRAPLPSFDPLLKVFAGEEIPNDPKREVIRNFIGLGETEPRITCPVLPRSPKSPPPESLPLLYYLPGIDGTGLAAYRQFPLLVKAFDLRAMVLPPDCRRSFKEIMAAVQEHLRYEVSRSAPNRPVYLLGESFGGLLCMALACACRDMVDRVIVVNPASSFTRTPWASMGSLLTVLPQEVYRLLPFALAPVLTNPFSIAMHDVDGRGNPLEQASDFAFGLVGLLPELNHLKLALPADTLSFRLELLKQGCLATAPLLQKIPQRVLILAGELDLLIPSQEEAQRLKRVLPRASVKVLQGRTHALLQEAGVDLLAIMEDEGFYCRTRRLSSDPVSPLASGSNATAPAVQVLPPTAPGVNGSSYVSSRNRAATAAVGSGTTSATGNNVGTSSYTAGKGNGWQPPLDGSSGSSNGTWSSGQNGASINIISDNLLPCSSSTSNGTPIDPSSFTSPSGGLCIPPGTWVDERPSSSPPPPPLSASGDGVLSSGEESDGDLVIGAVNTVTSVTIASCSGITSLNATLADVLPPNAEGSTRRVGTAWETATSSTGIDGGSAGTAEPFSGNGTTLSPRRRNGVTKPKRAKRRSSTNFGSAGPVELPTAREVELAFERTGFGLFKNLVSPVYFSTDASGRMERGLSAIPLKRPLLFVGNHQLLDPSLPLMIEEFLKETGVLLRGLAHPAVSRPRQEQVAVDFGSMNMAMRAMAEATGGDGSSPPGIVNFMTTWGAVPVGPKNIYALLQQGEAVLLYPGGVREAYKLKNERYKLIWPERSEFVRMAARLGATIVPFAAIGAEDGVTQLLDSREMSQLPVVGEWLLEQAKKLPSARNGVNVDKELEDLFVQPLLLPGVPSRYYYKFCRPIVTTPEMADDKDECEELYRQVKSSVDGGLGWLLRKRETDPYKDLLPRIAYELTHPEEQAPTFRLDA